MDSSSPGGAKLYTLYFKQNVLTAVKTFMLCIWLYIRNLILCVYSRPKVINKLVNSYIRSVIKSVEHIKLT